MQDTTLQPSSRNKELSAHKLPIMHVIGNYLDDCHGRSSVLIPTLSMSSPGVLMSPTRSSGVLKGSLMLTCGDTLPAHPHDCSGAGGGKCKKSKLEGKRKMRYKIPNFPTTSDFPSTLSLRRTGEFGVIIQ